MSEDREESQDKLDYRDGHLDRRKYDPAMMQFVGGIVIGALAVIVLGVALMLATFQLHGTGPPQHRRPIVVLFLTIAIVGLGATKRVHRRAQFVLAGILCGAGAIAMIEGFCFSGN